MTIRELASCLSNYDIISIFESEKMVYDGLVKDLHVFLNEEVRKIDVVGYKQLRIKI